MHHQFAFYERFQQHGHYKIYFESVLLSHRKVKSKKAKINKNFF